MIPGGLGRALLAALLAVALVFASLPSHAAAGWAAGWAPPPAVAPQLLPVLTGDAVLDGAERVALAVLARDRSAAGHLAAPSYNSLWIRDSFAWGMIPWRSAAGGSTVAYAGSELRYWLRRQLPDGAWITNQYSGWYDETPVLIAAVADAYRITGDRTLLLDALPRVRRAWSFLAQAIQPSLGSRYLLYAMVGPHVAADWVDQVARRGYATGLEALWYHATTSMAALEEAAGDTAAAGSYLAFAAGVRADINRLLWRVSAPHALHAAAVAPFGHYTGWLGPRDYFELDSNYLCILYGIAGPQQAEAIAEFTAAHAAYLLGLPYGVPARVVYGDYEPADYAVVHYALAGGSYHNAYWASVGALVAMGLARSGRRDLALAALRQIGLSFLVRGDASEWYRDDGTPGGAPRYQWPARMFILALYAVGLGRDAAPDPATTATAPTGCLGSGRALLLDAGQAFAVATVPPRGPGAGCTILALPLLGGGPESCEPASLGLLDGWACSPQAPRALLRPQIAATPAPGTLPGLDDTPQPPVTPQPSQPGAPPAMPGTR